MPILRARAMKPALAAIALATALTIIALMVFEVVQKLDLLATSTSDNVQWTLTQVEVDFTHFQNALLLVGEHDGSREDQLVEVRKRFDLFYSRIDTLNKGTVYSALMQDAQFADALSQVRAFIETTVPLIDSPDDALAAQIEAIEHAALETGASVRALILRGVAVFAIASDANRTSVAGTMLRLGLMTLTLIAALVLAIIMLNRLVRLSQEQAEQNLTFGTRLKTIISASLDAILVADTKGRILDFNGAAAQVFGYQPEEVIGQLMTDIIFPDHLIEAHKKGMDRYLQTREKRLIGKGRVRLEAKRRDGSLFPVEISIAEARGSDGDVFISFLRDFSDQAAAEAELRRARDEAQQGEQAKAVFLAVMSHEMRTPLNGLLGSIEILRGMDPTPQQMAFLATMEATGQLLLNHVNDVLDISGLETGKTRIENAPFNLQEMLQQVIESQKPAAQARRNKLSLVSMGFLPDQVSGDAARLRQIMTNLISNAVKFTQDGKITIEAERIDDTPIGPQVELRVIDTGIGIAEDQLERIFEDFVTIDGTYGRDAEGTGLGLGIAKRLTRAMGGEIGVESVEGAGSLFWVRLPLGGVAGAPPHPQADPAPAARAAQPVPIQLAAVPATPAPAQTVASAAAEVLRVLVVEDNQVNRMIAREFLTSAGHHVTEAVDGIDGLNRAEEEEFDLILMDISMPRLDGLQCTRRIRAGHGPCCTTPIIALTAHAMPSEIRDFLAAGFDICLTKPISRARLNDAIAKVLTGEGPSGAAESGETDLLDRTQLADLIGALSRERAADLVQRFVAEADEIVAQCADGRLRPGPTETQAVVHKLAGSSGTFGARHLQAHLARIETHLKTGASLDASLAMAALPPVWAGTRPLLLAELPDAPGR